MISKLNERGFNASSTGSLVRTFADIWADDASQVLDDVEFMASQTSASGATGGFIDLLGQLVGVRRLSATTSSVSASDRIIRFYTDAGYLYDLLPPSAQVGFAEIPAGTRVTDTSGIIVYETEATPVPQGVSEIYVSAAALEIGSDSAVPANVLVKHSLNEPNIRVVNTGAISAGSDTESDDNMRYRIANAHTTLQAANQTAVRIAALLTPGIANINLTANVYGPGTYKLMLIPEGNTVTEEQLQLARLNVANATGYGISAYIVEPDYVGINLVIQLVLTPGWTEVVRNNAVASARGIALDYIANIPMGGVFSPAIMEKRILEAEASTISAETILFCLDSVPYPASDHKLGETELLVLDSNLAEPVEVYV